MSSGPITWRSCAISHVGNVRKLNEDACLDRCEAGMWVVADGMGGHAAGDIASQLIVDTLAKIEPEPSLSAYVEAVETAILDINRELCQLATDHAQIVGSTIVVLLAVDNYTVVLWAGDSRLYRLRAGQMSQLTTDHSQIQALIEQGLLTQEQAKGHPAGNLVTRAVGAASTLSIDMDIFESQANDRYLLCSDGLDKHLSDADIAVNLSRGSIEEAAQELIDLALQRGGTDNVTVCVAGTSSSA